MINTAVFIGRVSTEIKTSKTKNNKDCCNFQIAVQRNYRDDADFPPIAAYGRFAEIISAYVQKGDMIGVRARYRSRIKNEKKYHEFVVEEIQLLQRRDSEGEYNDIQIPVSSDSDFDSDDFDDMDLPF